MQKIDKKKKRDLFVKFWFYVITQYTFSLKNVRWEWKGDWISSVSAGDILNIHILTKNSVALYSS